MNIARIVKERTTAIIKAAAHPDAAPMRVAAPVIDDTYFRYSNPNQTLEMLDDGVAAIWRDKNPHRSTIWVRQTCRDYKEKYISFLRIVYGASGLMPDHLDVDHLSNKSRAPADFWLRVEAVNQSANRSHGAAFEKRYGSSLVTAHRASVGKTPEFANYLIIAKLAGFMSPIVNGSAESQKRRQDIIEFFVSQGCDRDAITTSIVGLIELADRK